MWARKVISKQVHRYAGKHGIGKLSVSLFTCILVLLLSSCVTLSDPETSQEHSGETIAVITPEQSVGQTFVLRRARLNGVKLWLSSEQTVASVTAELLSALGDPIPIYSTTISVKDAPVTISIPAQDKSTPSYYLRLSTTTGEVQVKGRSEDIYTHGSAYVNDTPCDADLAFRVTYDYDWRAVLADLRDRISDWWLILPMGILLFLPGWLLIDLIGLRKRFDGGELVATSLGLSLALVPLLMLWTSWIGLRWGRVSVWVVAGLLVALVVWRLLRKVQVTSYQAQVESNKLKFERNQLQGDDRLTTIGGETLQFSIFNLNSTFRIPYSAFIIRHSAFILLIIIFAIALLTRFAMVRDLAGPAWVDSVHHALITRQIIENGGYPQSYQPYLPEEAMYYHAGYHSILATFIWLTGLEIPEAMQILGQVLNALIVFSLYLLTTTLTENRSAGLVAALIGGLFTPMPAYYASWGRYTQLAGLLVLPVGLALFKSSNDGQQRQKRAMIILLILTCAGLALIHNRVVIFLGLLLFFYSLLTPNWRDIPKMVGRITLVVAGTVLMTLPWLIPAFRGLVVPKTLEWSAGKVSLSGIPWMYLTPALGEVSLALAGIGLLLGLIWQRRFVMTILLWVGSLYFIANLGAIGLPGGGLITPISVEISWFMPLAVLGGYGIGQMIEVLDRYIPETVGKYIRWTMVALGAGAAILGAQRLLPTLNPDTFIFREADRAAIDWIGENVPAEEVILVNPTAWGYGLYRGADGGYWISPLTGHLTTPPSVLYGLGNPEYYTAINQMIEGLLPLGKDAQGLWEYLQPLGIRYVYLGVRGGILSARALSSSPLFESRYASEGAWVFETVDPP
jgi:hypothetical protein